MLRYHFIENLRVSSVEVFQRFLRPSHEERIADVCVYDSPDTSAARDGFGFRATGRLPPFRL